MKPTFMKGVVLGAVVSTVVTGATLAALAGTGVGGVFNLGQTNTVNASTILSGNTNAAQLAVGNSSTGANANGIKVTTPAATPPFVITSPKRVVNLNADTVDGVHAGALQRRVSGTCFPTTAIAAIAADGSTTCTGAGVMPVQLSNASGARSTFLGRLIIDAFCNISGTKSLAFRNGDPAVGTLNWSFSEGGTTSTVNATGVALAPNEFVSFNYTGRRLEGQWIFSTPSQVVTVTLHAFDGGAGGCEVRGSAVVAAG